MQMKRLLCFLGFHDPEPIRCVPRSVGVFLWDWFRDENYDYRCARCEKIRYGASGRWIREVDNGLA